MLANTRDFHPESAWMQITRTDEVRSTLLSANQLAQFMCGHEVPCLDSEAALFAQGSFCYIDFLHKLLPFNEELRNVLAGRAMENHGKKTKISYETYYALC